MRTAHFSSSGGGGGWGGLPLDAGHVTCDACWEANPPPCEQNDTHV